MEVPLSKKKSDIALMFDSIAPKYDFLNHALSFNIDRPWRGRLVRRVAQSGAKEVLDLACGTGDIARGLYKRGLNVIGVDISQKMLEIARKKNAKYIEDKSERKIEFLYGEADNIQYPDNTFDAVAISFGIRNFDNREQCIKEIYRVMKKGGTLAILEFTIPVKGLWKSIYTIYFKKVLPAIGKLVSKQKAPYTYLPASAFEFPQRESFCEELAKGGFEEVSYESLTGGVACLYLGRK